MLCLCCFPDQLCVCCRRLTTSQDNCNMLVSWPEENWDLVSLQWWETKCLGASQSNTLHCKLPDFKSQDTLHDCKNNNIIQNKNDIINTRGYSALMKIIQTGNTHNTQEQKTYLLKAKVPFPHIKTNCVQLFFVFHINNFPYIPSPSLSLSLSPSLSLSISQAFI